MPGTDIQLAAYGRQDLNLTGNPQVSYFKTIYKRYTNFAIENVQLMLNGNLDYGTRCEVTFNQKSTGDLLYRLFLNIELPSLNPNNVENFYASWTNAIGHAIIKSARINIGGNDIDIQYGLWLEIWNELTLTEEQKYGYYDMVGKHKNFNVTTQPGPLLLRIPLQFWFCRNLGLALPIVALQHHEVKLIIEFSNFNELWISSTGYLPCPASSYKMLNVYCFADYIFLDEDEKRWFAQNNHRYLIDLTYGNVISTDLTSTYNIIQLESFNHPVKELIWVIRDCIVFARVPGGGNEWFNFSNLPYYLNQPVKDPLEDSVIYIEGKERFWPPRKAKYFREEEAYKYHSNIPDNFIYIYSFGFYPEKYQPSGTCNFSMLDNVQLNVKVITELTNPQIFIFAPYYNILIVENGISGILYKN